MAARIARHRADRGAAWRTREAPLDLAAAIREEDKAGATLLIDCLTLWTSNLLLAGHHIPAASAGLVTAVSHATAHIVLVSNEVGYGIVPDNALARAFRDAAGTVNQRVAAVVSRVDLVVAGLSLRVK